MFLCPGPVPSLLGWAYPEQLGLSSIACGLVWTGVGQFHSFMHKWGFAPLPNCECGASEQTADHVLTACPMHRAPHGARDLTVLDDKTQCWLNVITATSDPGSAAAWDSKKIKSRPQSCLCLTWSGCPSNDDDGYT